MVNLTKKIERPMTDAEHLSLIRNVNTYVWWRLKLRIEQITWDRVNMNVKQQVINEVGHYVWIDYQLARRTR